MLFSVLGCASATKVTLDKQCSRAKASADNDARGTAERNDKPDNAIALLYVCVCAFVVVFTVCILFS